MRGCRGPVGAAIALMVAVFVGAPAHAAERVEPDVLHDPTLEVFMRVAASPKAVHGVYTTLSTDPRVARFAFLDHAAAHRAASRVLDEDDLRGVSPSALPQSFRVELADPSEAEIFAAEMGNLNGVDDVVVRRTPLEDEIAERRSRACFGDRDLEVFMDVSATAREVRDVARRLRRLPEVRTVVHRTKRDALEIFGCLFADDPRVEMPTASQLPESFAVRTRVGTWRALVRLTERIERWAGVDDVGD